MAKGDELSETVARDWGEFACCVCTELLLRPCTLICGHTICMHCLSQWMNVSSQGWMAMNLQQPL